MQSLRKLGVEGEIIAAKTGGKTFLDIICELEESSISEVILLLDFDRRGKEMTRNLKQQLEKTNIKPNLEYWNTLLNFVGKEIKDIEGLYTYTETLRKKICSV